MAWVLWNIYASPAKPQWVNIGKEKDQEGVNSTEFSKLTYQTLFNKQTEDDSIAHLPEALEDLSAQVWVLDHVIELGVVVTQHTWSKQQVTVYCQISYIWGTKSKILSVSRLFLHLSLCNLLKSGVKFKNEDVVGTALPGDVPTTSEWSTILLPKV